MRRLVTSNELENGKKLREEDDEEEEEKEENVMMLVELRKTMSLFVSTVVRAIDEYVAGDIEIKNVKSVVFGATDDLRAGVRKCGVEVVDWKRKRVNAIFSTQIFFHALATCSTVPGTLRHADVLPSKEGM